MKNEEANTSNEKIKRFSDPIPRDDKCNKIVKKVDPPPIDAGKDQFLHQQSS